MADALGVSVRSIIRAKRRTPVVKELRAKHVREQAKIRKQKQRERERQEDARLRELVGVPVKRSASVLTFSDHPDPAKRLTDSRGNDRRVVRTRTKYPQGSVRSSSSPRRTSPRA